MPQRRTHRAHVSVDLLAWSRAYVPQPSDRRIAHGTDLASESTEKEVRAMLWTIVLVLLVLWLLGVVALPTVGSLIHILLVLALVVLVFQMLSGRRTAL
jgi:Flp pilus assembly protein TadB